MPLVWYEAILRSDTFCTAFQQNEKLELGNEVKWSSEEVLTTGATEALVQKASDMVKKMDGVGYWNDNRQSGLVRSVGPAKKPAADQYVEKYW